MSGRFARDLLYWAGSWGLLAGTFGDTSPVAAIIWFTEWAGVPSRWIPDVEGWVDARSSLVFYVSFVFFIVGVLVWAREEASRDKVIFVEVWSLLFMLQSSSPPLGQEPGLAAVLRIAWSWGRARWAGVGYGGFYRGVYMVISSVVDAVMTPVSLIYLHRGDRAARVEIEGSVTIEDTKDDKPTGAVDVPQYARI